MTREKLYRVKFVISVPDSVTKSHLYEWLRFELGLNGEISRLSVGDYLFDAELNSQKCLRLDVEDL
jgi:hypothetical protein